MTSQLYIILGIIAGFSGFLLGFVSLFVNGYFCDVKKSKFLLAIFGTLMRDNFQ